MNQVGKLSWKLQSAMSFILLCAGLVLPSVGWAGSKAQMINRDQLSQILSAVDLASLTNSNAIFLYRDFVPDRGQDPLLASAHDWALQILPHPEDDISQLFVATGVFQLPVSIHEISAPGFWEYSHMQSLFKGYRFSTQIRNEHGSDGRVSIPAGFSFGLLPSHLECDSSLRHLESDDIEKLSLEEKQLLSAVSTGRGLPSMIVIQKNSNCNMLFSYGHQINLFYPLTATSVAVVSLNYLYVNDTAVRKLDKIGNPTDTLGAKVKDQIKDLMAAFQLQRRKS
ncbi:MAG: hypothetical protein COT73_08850 [Bdellovibrio sp. CG10_big_fil_rev_8_21_14_0_10_47_8]|nr:MAG: hypothetical protein COT73_08850 [Bdellovibrio sp. CG10_big_fil_rev_8_21_14_0_10_47_8]